jgi:hypothetical protein
MRVSFGFLKSVQKRGPHHFFACVPRRPWNQGDSYITELGKPGYRRDVPHFPT